MTIAWKTISSRRRHLPCISTVQSKIYTSSPCIMCIVTTRLSLSICIIVQSCRYRTDASRKGCDHRAHATFLGMMVPFPEDRAHVPGRRPRDVLSGRYCLGNWSKFCRITVTASNLVLISTTHACDDEAAP
jgi:hypothetical protein